MRFPSAGVVENARSNDISMSTTIAVKTAFTDLLLLMIYHLLPVS